MRHTHSVLFDHLAYIYAKFQTLHSQRVILHAPMGNVFAVQQETRIMKLKKIIKSLERHRRAITYKVTRVNRELNIIETKLRSHIIKTSSEKAKKRTNSRLYDSSTQVAPVNFLLSKAQQITCSF